MDVFDWIALGALGVGVYLVLDLTLGRQLRSRWRERENRKRRLRAIYRDLADYERRNP